MWERLFKELTQNAAGDSAQLAFRPSTADLDGFEAERGFKLPQSYRDYASVFGPGLLSRYFRVAVPGCRALGSGFDLASLDEDSSSHAPAFHLNELHEGADVAQLQRMVFFCSTEEGDESGWDPTELTDRPGSEYEIYFVPRLGPEVVRIANSFPEFITDICLGSRLPEYVNFDPDEWGIPYRRVFQPVHGA